MGQAVARGQGEKDISGCQFCFISGSGVLLEQSKISRLLTVPQKSMELNKFDKNLNIQAVPKVEQKALLATNDETNHQRHIFKAESHDLHFCAKSELQDIIWLDVCRPPKATRPPP